LNNLKEKKKERKRKRQRKKSVDVRKRGIREVIVKIDI